jgi:hypothetical protein
MEEQRYQTAFIEYALRRNIEEGFFLTLYLIVDSDSLEQCPTAFAQKELASFTCSNSRLKLTAKRSLHSVSDWVAGLLLSNSQIIAWLKI